VRGQDVTVAGSVEGSISASGRLLILKSGRVVGDVTVRSILIEEGGVLSGRCQMQSG
jgi:cytoskeletal protein CcmA (bactofilin family)